MRKFVLALLGWNRTSLWLMSAFLALVGLIGYFWWPLLQEYLSYYDPSYPWWIQMDWLMLGIFTGMSLLIMAKADLSKDLWIIGVGLVGGLVIESWGTQTELWVYYTLERPPLWIIPAWPIASLSIDRLVRISQNALPHRLPMRFWQALYGLTFGGFAVLMAIFVSPTWNKSLTIAASLLVLFLSLTPTDWRTAVITFWAGAGLGYFLELWGTTRECWTYYTAETPPLFAVLAHGMAAVAFWRAMLVSQRIFHALAQRLPYRTTLPE